MLDGNRSRKQREPAVETLLPIFEASEVNRLGFREINCSTAMRHLLIRRVVHRTRRRLACGRLLVFATPVAEAHLAAVLSLAEGELGSRNRT